jgi:ATP-binding cassette, subfamily B, bacterial
MAPSDAVRSPRSFRQAPTFRSMQSFRAARQMVVFAWAADSRLAAWTFALLSAEALVASLFSLWLRMFADAVAGHQHTAAVLGGLAVAASIAGTAALDHAGNRTRMSLGDRTQFLLERRLLEIVGRSPTLAIHQTPEYLRELELLQAESWEFSQTVPSIVEAITTAVRIVVTAVLLASITPLLLLLPLFGLPMLALSGHTTDLFNRGNELAAEPSRRAEMLYRLAANRHAAGELRLFRLRGELLGRFTAEHHAIRDIHVRLAVRGQSLRLIGRTVFLAGYVGAIVLVVRLAARGAVSVGDVAMTAVLAGQALTLVAGSAEHAQWLQRTLTTAGRYLFLEQVAETSPSASAGWPTYAPAKSVRPGVPDRLATGIELAGVSYRYPGHDRPTLRDLSAVLPAGITVAIVGDNGAGKTTLVSLLAGLSRPTSGRILVDGTDLAALDPEAWRLHISAGFQDHARFEFTIGRAVGLGWLPSAADAGSVTAALDRAGAADLATHGPAGLATQLGPEWPGGIDLSGGQWQKLAIGRAMMRPEPLLLLLDEPTAAIDAETEHELFARWTRATGHARRRSGAITVLVSHRLATVRMADLILVLRDGGICERGTHEELVAARGWYAELFELQARAYR